MPDQASHQDLLALTTEIVSAHVSNNTVSTNDLTGLIETVFRTLSGLGDSYARVRRQAATCGAD